MNKQIEEMIKYLNDAIVYIQKLEAENKEIKKCYSAVSKFDDCRAALARAVKQLGSDPSDFPKGGDWHEYLIKELDRLLEDRLRKKLSSDTASHKGDK